MNIYKESWENSFIFFTYFLFFFFFFFFWFLVCRSHSLQVAPLWFGLVWLFVFCSLAPFYSFLCWPFSMALLMGLLIIFDRGGGGRWVGDFIRNSRTILLPKVYVTFNFLSFFSAVINMSVCVCSLGEAIEKWWRWWAGGAPGCLL